MSIFTPETSGSITLDSIPPDYFDRLESRIREGLFIRGNRFRAQYSVRRRYEDSIEFGADTLGTAIGIGLNEVAIRRTGGNTLEYAISFRRWLNWVVLFSSSIGIVVFAVGFFLPEMAKTFGELQAARFIFPLAILFWCGAWPFSLSALHKPVVRRVLERILREEAGEVVGAYAPSKHDVGYRYESEARMFGLPLVSIAFGPHAGAMRGHAKGVIAIGDTARGIIAIGGASVGVISFGGASVGLLASFGGLSLGGIALGGAAFGGIAIGGLAVGIVAFGGAALGIFAVGGGALGLYELPGILSGK